MAHAYKVEMQCQCQPGWVSPNKKPSGRSVRQKTWAENSIFSHFDFVPFRYR
jgi:hypothetical protein